MGVLVGTSLIVIIPEGVETLYSSTGAYTHATRSLLISRTDLSEIPPLAHLPRASGIADPFSAMPGPVIPANVEVPPVAPTASGSIGIMQDSEGFKPDSKTGAVEEGHDTGGSNHAFMGLALISGFVLMYLIDKLPEYTSPAKPNQTPYHISLNDLGRRFNRASPTSATEEGERFISGTTSQASQSRSLATTIGLVIHAAADGIALGASSSTSNTGLSFIIFFAIMIHKAPAAFGLTSVLLKQGLSKRSTRTHLVVFSLAAPTGALLTWAIAHALGLGATEDPQRTKWWTGILLLFSGGTFLYVAMHTMQEVSSTHTETHMNGHAGGTVEASTRTEQNPSIKDLGAAVFGMILPLFLQVGHAH